MKKTRIFMLSLVLILPFIGTSVIVNAAINITNTGVVGENTVVSDSIIAFTVWEGWVGDLNEDGDTDDYEVRYYNISDGSVESIAFGRLPSVSGSIITFFTIEWYINEDLNEDGDKNDWVVRYYDTSVGSEVYTVSDGISPGISGSIIAFTTEEMNYGQDLNEDGDINDRIIRYYDTSDSQLINTGELGGMTSISGSIIVFAVYESWVGDLNGDGDTNDWVVRYYDTSDGKMVDTGQIGQYPSVSGSIITFFTNELDIDQDLNDDGDTNDIIIRYYDISNGSTTNTGERGRYPSISGSRIAFDTYEFPDVDLNGDGDKNDWVVRYYDISDESTTNTGEVGTFPSISGSIIAFTTKESMISQDLNGDGDTNDTVIRYITLEKNPTIQAISELIDAFIEDGSIDNKGIGNALLAFVEQAQAMIDRDNITAALNKLNALIHLVEAQSDKHISTEAAQILIENTEGVIDSL